MLVNYFGKDINSVIADFKRKYHVSVRSSSSGMVYGCTGIDINEHIEFYTHSIYTKKDGDKKDLYSHSENYLHIEITGINLTKGKSLEKFVSSFNSILTRASYEKGGIFLLDLHSNKESKKRHALLLKFNSIYCDENNQRVIGENSKYVYSILKKEIDEYCKRNHMLQSNVKLTLINLCAFDRLKFNSDELEKYIQLKNKELSRCTEEELNKQAEKFINPHNYPHYFKNEVFACQGAEIVKRIGVDSYSKAANQALNSLDPDSTVQPLQVLTLAAIGKSTRQ